MSSFRRFSFYSLFTLLGWSGVSLQAQATKSATAEAKVGSLWKITDADNTVYLAGSVHALRAEDMPISPAYDQVYQDSEEVIFELEMGLMSDPATLMKIRQKGMLPPGETLGDHFSADTVKRIQQYAFPFGLPPADLSQMKPGMVFITISMLEAVRVGAKPELGLETTFYEKVMADGKPTRGLETAEYQISRFDDIATEELEKLINVSLDEAENKTSDLGELIAAWNAGDAEELDNLISRHMKDNSDVRRLLLSERNENWIPEVEKAIAGKTNTMFLVGAAHLVGNDSVVKLLQDKGHTVTQVGVKAAAAGE